MKNQRNATFIVLAILLLIIVGLMTWQAFINSKANGKLDTGWWIGSVSTLVLGSLAIFLGYQASGPSWSESVADSLEKLVSFTEGLSSGVDRIGTASQRVQKTIKPNVEK